MSNITIGRCITNIALSSLASIVYNGKISRRIGRQINNRNINNWRISLELPRSPQFFRIQVHINRSTMNWIISNKV